MILIIGQNITQYSRNDIPMPDKFINAVNTFDKYQQEHFTFRDIKGRLIGEVKLIWVDGEPTETAQQIETVEGTDPEQ